MRICYIIWSLGLGGAEQVVIRIATALAGRGHDVSVAMLNEEGVFAARLHEQRIPMVALHKRGPLDVPSSGSCPGCSLDAGVPAVVATEHNVDVWKRGHHLRIDRYLARRTDALIAVSTQVHDFYVGRGVVGAWRVIYNGVNAGPSPCRRRGPEYGALGIGEAEPVVGFIGRLVAAKAPSVFVDAFSRMSRAVPGSRALVIGEGPLRELTEREATQRGCRGRVVFAGLRDDLQSFLSGMDVLVFSSEREGLSMAMLEAMAAGLPVVVTRVGGTPELIESEVTGLLVEPGDAAGLAAGVIEVLRDRERSAALAQAARTRVERDFSLRRMVDEHEKLYASVIRGRSGRSSAASGLGANVERSDVAR